MQPGAVPHGHRRILLTNHHLQVRAGSELVTVELARAFSSRGHAVALFTFLPGPLSEAFSEETGIPVFTAADPSGVKAWAPDVLHIHHWPTLVYLRGRGITAPAVLGFLGRLPDLENPPPVWQEEFLPWWGISETVLANVGSTPGWTELPHSLVRNWFDDDAGRRPMTPRASPLRSVLVVSNHFPAEIWNALTVACATIGATVVHVGLPDNPQVIDQDLLAAHDAVITLGRTAIQAMAAGVPVLVLDHFGSDGWVTPDSLPELAAHNFSGRAFARPAAEDDLIRWLSSPPSAQELAAVQDWAWSHCTFSTGLAKIERLHQEAIEHGGARNAPPWVRLVSDAIQAARDGEVSHATLLQTQDTLLELRTELDRQSTRADLLAQRLTAIEALLADVLDSASWRVTSPARYALGGLRRLRPRS